MEVRRKVVARFGSPDSGLRSTNDFAIVQIVAIAAIALYLARWRMGFRRRNAQTWESLLARLRPDWSARELSDHFL